MTILASTLIDRLSKQLLDVTNVRWARTELLGWLSVGQRLIVMLQPSATNTIVSVRLAAGTRQTIPANGWVLLDVLRNMGAAGNAPGRAIRLVSRRLMDSYNPNWHSDASSATVYNCIFDPQDQTSFFVYPPSNGTQYVELNYSAIPADLASEASPISVPDAYEEPLQHYVMFRALTKNAEWAASPTAEQYLTLFNGAMGAKVTAEQANNPNLALGPSGTSTGGVS